MPSFTITYTLVDAYNRTTTKTVETTDNVVDFAAALAMANAFAGDLAAISELRVLWYVVSQRVTFVDAVTAGANRDEGATLQFRKSDYYLANVKVPGPIQAIRNADGTIAIAHQAVVDFVANWLATPGLTLSDGEIASEFVGGTLDL